MHIGSNNINFEYEMHNNWLSVSNEEKDLGVIVSNDLKSSSQCLAVKNKANRILGIINRGVSFKSEEVIRKLYTSYVRPHLEYCIQFWSPYLIKDIDMLEAVQRRATKMIPSLKKLPYEQRLRKLNLFSLAKRRLRGDMIEVYKIIHGIDKVDLSNLFVFNDDDRLRKHNFHIRIKRHINKNSCLYFFTRRVIKYWNGLPEIVVNSSSLNTFKNNLDSYMANDNSLY